MLPKTLEELIEKYNITEEEELIWFKEAICNAYMQFSPMSKTQDMDSVSKSVLKLTPKTKEAFMEFLASWVNYGKEK